MRLTWLLGALATPVLVLRAGSALAYGEPMNGYPSHDERLILVTINRVRADPNDQAAGNASMCSTPHPPIPPVAIEPKLNRSARFHCNHLILNMGGLSHQTFCNLMPDVATSGCDGHAACSCIPGSECWKCDTLGGCGTGPSERATLFGFSGWASEVGAAGYGAAGAATGWATECPGAEGHRDALSDGNVNVAGPGFASGAGCWGDYEFTDFGKVPGLATPRIPSAIDTGAGFEANYYDAAGDPMSIDVVVDGTCHPMTAAVGINPGNRDYRAMVAPTGSCQEYYVVARDKGGMVARFPDTGSYTIGCAMDYVPTQKDADCSACNPGETRVCMMGACAGMQTCNGGMWSACDCAMAEGAGPGATAGSGGPSGGPTGGSTGAGAGGAPADDASGDVSGSCGCKMADRDASPGAIAITIALLGLALGRRRRVLRFVQAEWRAVASARIGRSTMNVDPAPSSLSTVTVPPCARAICSTR